MHQMNETERMFLYPFTIEKTDQDVIMVARYWFQIFTMSQIDQMKSLIGTGAPVAQVGDYFVHYKDDYLVLDDTKSPRTIMVLASKIKAL